MSSSTSQPHPDISHGEIKVFALKSISNKHLISVMHPDVCWVFSLSPSCSGYRVSSRVSQSVVLCLRFQAQQDHFQAYNPSPSAHPWSGLAHFPIKNYRLWVLWETELQNWNQYFFFRSHVMYRQALSQNKPIQELNLTWWKKCLSTGFSMRLTFEGLSEICSTSLWLVNLACWGWKSLGSMWGGGWQ